MYQDAMQYSWAFVCIYRYGLPLHFRNFVHQQVQSDVQIGACMWAGRTCIMHYIVKSHSRPCAIATETHTVADIPSSDLSSLQLLLLQLMP